MNVGGGLPWQGSVGGRSLDKDAGADVGRDERV